MVAALLVDHEDDQYRDAAERGQQHLGVGEVGELAALDDAVDQQHQADDGQQHAQRVEPAGVAGPWSRGPAAPSRPARRPRSGTLTRKTEPHQKCSSSRPPVIGPMAIARPTPPAQMPMALGCSSRSKTFIRMARVAGITKAPPRPISARKAMSSAGEDREGREHRADAEHGQAEEQHLLAADAVAEEARGEQQPGEDQGIGVDRPFELALRGPQPLGLGEAIVLIATFRIELSSTTISRLSIRAARIAQRRRYTASEMRGAARAPVGLAMTPTLEKFRYDTVSYRKISTQVGPGTHAPTSPERYVMPPWRRSGDAVRAPRDDEQEPLR